VNHRAQGFTLVELLLAMTLAAMVATSALGALGMFAEADAALVHGGESEVDVARTLRLLRADVQAAATLDVQARQWSITRNDGTAVV
jgi:prepilin-type N-terminal cleavage/methylation domain-containing protein